MFSHFSHQPFSLIFGEEDCMVRIWDVATEINWLLGSMMTDGRLMLTAHEDSGLISPYLFLSKRSIQA